MSGAGFDPVDVVVAPGQVMIIFIDHAEAIDALDRTEVAATLHRLVGRPGCAAVIATADPYAAQPLLPAGVQPSLLTDSGLTESGQTGSGAPDSSEDRITDESSGALVGAGQS